MALLMINFRTIRMSTEIISKKADEMPTLTSGDVLLMLIIKIVDKIP